MTQKPCPFGPLTCWSRRACLAAVAALAAGLTAAPAFAQLPYARLFVVTPPGAKAGSSVEVSLAGADLEDVAALVFNHPSLTAERVPDPMKAGQFVPNKFKVNVAADVPVGLYDVRAVGRFGISNPRAFAVGDLPEVAEKEPNNDLPQAQRIDLNSTVNGTINPNVDVDYYRFSGRGGQRVVVHCAASSIDSRLDPEVRVFNAANRLLGVNRRYADRDAVVDVVLPADGDYLVRVVEHAHQTGGAEHFYRLTVSLGPWIDAVYPPVVEPGKPTAITLWGRNLPGGQPDPVAKLDGRPLDRLTVQVTPPGDPLALQRLAYSGAVPPPVATLDGFEYRVRNGLEASNPVLLTYAAGPVVLDNDDNDTPEKAQVITVPCDVCGRIEKRRDRDWYAFTAKANEAYVIEAFADRLGAPMDVYFELRRADNKQMLGEFDDNPEVLTPVKFHTRTDDPKTRFVVPADGRYEIVVGSRDSDVRAGPRHIYRLNVRKDQPDFRLVLVDDHGANPGALDLGQGGSRHLEVLCVRKDGFAGEVTVSAEGLPPGVTCPPQVLGPNMTQTALVFTAAPDAPPFAGPVQVKGTATIGGQQVVREARGACIVWPIQQELNYPAISRLSRAICLAVREKAPFTVEPGVKELSVPVGATVALKIKVNRQWPDMKNPVQVVGFDLPPNLTFNNNNQPVTIPPDKAEADVQVQVKPNVPPGIYNLVLRATGQVPFNKDPKAPQKPPVNVAESAPPIRMKVYNTVAEVSVSAPAVTLKPGAEQELTVKVNRLNAYAGEFKVQLVLPQGFQGVTAAEATIPAGANEAKLVLKCPANAQPAANPNVVIRAVATIDKVTLNHDAKVNVTIAK